MTSTTTTTTTFILKQKNNNLFLYKFYININKYFLELDFLF